MNLAKLLPIILLVSTTAIAQQRVKPDGNGGWIISSESLCSEDLGPAGRASCLGELQRDVARKAELDVRLREQEIENQRLQNEILMNKLEQQQRAAAQSDNQITLNTVMQHPDFMAWRIANPWFAKDRAKTEFAMLYGKQLLQERRFQIGRPCFDAVALKVEQVFGR